MTQYPDPLDTDEAVLAALEAEAAERGDANPFPLNEEEYLAEQARQEAEDAERQEAARSHAEVLQARARALLALAEEQAGEDPEPEPVVDVGAIIAQEQAALKAAARRAAAATEVHTISSAYDIDPEEAKVLAAMRDAG